jgi:hypothetical protein
MGRRKRKGEEKKKRSRREEEEDFLGERERDDGDPKKLKNNYFN